MATKKLYRQSLKYYRLTAIFRLKFGRLDRNLFLSSKIGVHIAEKVHYECHYIAVDEFFVSRLQYLL